MATLRELKEFTKTVTLAGGAAAVTEYVKVPENIVAIWASTNADQIPASGSIKTATKHADGTSYDLHDTVIATIGNGNTAGTPFVLGDASNSLTLPIEYVQLIYEPHAANATIFIFRILFLVENN